MSRSELILGTLIAGVVLVSFLISLWIVGWVKRNALRLGLIDMPNERKVHTVPIPRGGGVGIWLGVVSVFAIGTLAVAIANAWPSLMADVLPSSVGQMLPGLWSK
ncbi:MAG: hypothetical protein WCP62_03720, partial [Planctomycetota bacterium]